MNLFYNGDILQGSCGLKYELDYSTSGAKKSAHPVYGKGGGTDYTSIIYFVIIAFVLYLLYLTMTSTREGNEGDRSRGSYWPGDDPRRPPHPPGFRPYPPSYDEACNKNTGSGSAGTSNMGFWSGFGLGQCLQSSLFAIFEKKAIIRKYPVFPFNKKFTEKNVNFANTDLGGLGGYLFNNYWNRNNYGYNGAYRRRPEPTYTQFERDTGFYSDDRPSTSRDYSSNTTHTSSGFGGTERR
jgi:hypothetical protein